MGWDALRAGRNRGTLALAAFLLALSLGLLTAVLVQRQPIVNALAAKRRQIQLRPA